MAKILVVDDQATNRQFLTTLLSYGGHHLLEAEDGAAGLAQAMAEKPDLIIADILMPTMDGYEFVRQLRIDPQIGDTPVIFYTASYHEHEAHNLATSCHVSHVLLKPSDPETILKVVNEAINGGAPVELVPISKEFEREHLNLLTNRLARTNQRIEALLLVTQQLANERRADNLLAHLCTAARAIVGSRFAVAEFLEKGRLGASHFHLSGADQDTAAHIGRPRLLHGVAHQLLAGRHSLRLADINADPLASNFPPAYLPTRSFLGVPIRSSSHLYGVLYLIEKLGAPEFNEEEERFATTLAAQAAVAYENLLRYEEIVQRASAIAQQMEERRKAEEALRISEERYRTLMESSPEAIVVIDAERGCFVDANNNALRLYGLPAGDLFERGLVETSPAVQPDGRLSSEAAAEYIQTAMAGGSPVFEWVHQNSSGMEIPCEVRLALLPSAGRQCVRASVIDITARKSTEQEIRSLNADLERRVLERTSAIISMNKELEAFTYSVAHDLRSPLRRIDGFSRILSEQHSAGLTDEMKNCLEEIGAAVTHMNELIDELMKLAQVGLTQLNLEPTEMQFLIQEVISEFRKETEGRRVDWKVGSLPIETCDRGLLRIAFTNLLSNALKFSRPREVAVIEAGVIALNGWPVFYVRDNGVGFSMKNSPRLFGVFQRLHAVQDFEGTGIGLATVQRIIHKHGGRIWAEAEVDRGATFYFTIGTKGTNQLQTETALRA